MANAYLVASHATSATNRWEVDRKCTLISIIGIGTNNITVSGDPNATYNSFTVTPDGTAFPSLLGHSLMQYAGSGVIDSKLEVGQTVYINADNTGANVYSILVLRI